MFTRRNWIQAALSASALTLMGPQTGWGAPMKTPILVYRKHRAACCDGWVAHLEQNGFDVEEVKRFDMEQVKKDYEIPAALLACHTAVLDGYIVEGHVPAASIRELLARRPLVRGIAIAGSPAGASGNEGSQSAVVAFDGAGKITPFPKR